MKRMEKRYKMTMIEITELAVTKEGGDQNPIHSNSQEQLAFLLLFDVQQNILIIKRL